VNSDIETIIREATCLAEEWGLSVRKSVAAAKVLERIVNSRRNDLDAAVYFDQDQGPCPLHRAIMEDIRQDGIDALPSVLDMLSTYPSEIIYGNRLVRWEGKKLI
jgi:hypothetical protein